MSPTIHLDFSGIEEFEPLPKGQYPVTIESVELRESSEKPGSYYLNWTLTISDGEYSGRKIWYTNGLTEKSMYYLYRQFLDLGVIDEETVDLDLEIDEETNFLIYPQLAGLGCTADVGTQIRNGRIQNTVSRLYLESDPPFEPSSTPSKSAGETPRKPTSKGNKDNKPKFR